MDDGLANELMSADLIRQSGRAIHTNTCSTSRAPAYTPGPCDCGTVAGAYQGVNLGSNPEEVGSSPTAPATYVDDVTGFPVVEDWWPGDALPT